MTEYEFGCPKCRKVFTRMLNPHEPEESKMVALCDCGQEALRIFGAVLFRIAEPNGPDGINLGLGKHFKSVRERDYFADSHGKRLLKDG